MVIPKGSTSVFLSDETWNYLGTYMIFYPHIFLAGKTETDKTHSPVKCKSYSSLGAPPKTKN